MKNAREIIDNLLDNSKHLITVSTVTVKGMHVM